MMSQITEKFSQINIRTEKCCVCARVFTDKFWLVCDMCERKICANHCRIAVCKKCEHIIYMCCVQCEHNLEDLIKVCKKCENVFCERCFTENC